MRLSWTDPVFRSVVWQIVIVGIVVAIGWYLVRNTNENLAARHIATGFGFLGRVAGIPIGESLLPYNPAVNTYGRALLIGVLNTLQVAVIGVVLATHPGCADRHRAAVEELAAGEADGVLRRDSARHPAAAAVAVLVHHAAGPAGAETGLASRQRRLPVQPRHEGCRCWTGNRRIPGRCWRSSPALHRHDAVEPSRPQAAGGDRRSPHGLAGRAWRC